MQTYKMEKLDDGMRSYDCVYCGNSYLEKRGVLLHYRNAHKPQMERLWRYFRTLSLEQFAMIWTGFVMRRIPKRERTREHFQRIFLRDAFAVEVARRGM
jgi:hypothetical protein